MKKHLAVFVILVALVAAVPAVANGDVLCSSFPDGFVTGVIPRFYEGEVLPAKVVPEGTHSYNIIVDADCYLSPGVILNGNIIEPENTEWSIYIDPVANVHGTVQEKGTGDVRGTVGHGEVFHGKISEEGPGVVWMWVDGFFGGRVEEKDDGFLNIYVFGPYPAGGPGIFSGSAQEENSGDAILGIFAGANYRGSFKEEGAGECFFEIELPDEQPKGNVNCD